MTNASMDQNMPPRVASLNAACPLSAVVIAAGLLLSSAEMVAAQTDMERQAQCELSAIRDTRSPLAVQSIRSACNWLVVNGDSLLNASSKGYYVCLVRQLSGAQSNEAAAAIMSACRASNPL
ncbi:VF_A0006 family four-cysteine protein [Bradyrhizobium guangzhouense]|uniref:VF_A0006 family four-cysteine protein n=1 Tax=Bradyrhizobium guangzhouense TaxID=1325095 RepID=UPI001FE1C9A8|nr:VF_A0006 family four-cysteine protein [Bradyrhizobium guangzhouense]